jgi:sporulation protein YlmC with PRC-barrel domain
MEDHKMRKHLTIILMAIVGLSLGMNGFASEKNRMKMGKGFKAAESHRINAFMTHEIIDSQVYNLQGEKLGKIKDLVLDIDTGSIVYAVLDFGGFMGIGEKHFLVPWKSFATLPSEGIFYLDKSKEQLKNASGFDKTKTPDIGDMKWGAEIHRHNHDDYGYYDEYGYGYDAHGYGPFIVQWKNDPSIKIFDPNTIITIEGQLVKVEPVFDPEYGMTLELLVCTSKKQIQRAYLGPCRYIAAGQERRFKAGDTVTVIGSQVTRNNEPYIIATTVKRGNGILKLRDDDGIAAWVGWKKK